jgi:predicted MFS family arabinose efflux permease
VCGGVVAFTAVAAVAVYLIVRDAPAGHPFLTRTPEPPSELLRGLVEVLRIRNLRFILALNFCNYACTFTVQGLWGGPFLREVHGLSKIASGNVLLSAVLAYQVGVLVFGPLDRVFDTRKRIAMAGSLLIAGVLALLALWPHPPAFVAMAAIVSIGFFSACSSMIMTHGRGTIPDRLIGRGMATINTAVMLGVACMQTISGVIIGAFPRLPDGGLPEDAYRTLFGVMATVLMAAVAIYSRSTDVRPSVEMQAAKAKELAKVG